MDVKRIHEPGNIVAWTKQHHLVANPKAIQQSGKLGIFSRDSRANKNTPERKLGASRQFRQGSDKILVILVGMPAGDASYDELAVIYRPALAQQRARLLVRFEDGQVITVRYYRPIRARIACSNMAP